MDVIVLKNCQMRFLRKLTSKCILTIFLGIFTLNLVKIQDPFDFVYMCFKNLYAVCLIPYLKYVSKRLSEEINLTGYIYNLAISRLNVCTLCNEKKNWLTAKCWSNLCRVSQMNQFNSLFPQVSYCVVI